MNALLSIPSSKVSFEPFAQVKTALAADGDPAATIYAVQITKGRDHTFSGAVDALVVNGRTFDFEPFGVRG